MNIEQFVVIPCNSIEKQTCEQTHVAKSQSQNSCADSTNTEDESRDEPMMEILLDQFKVERLIYKNKDTKVFLVQDKQNQQYLIAKVTDLPDNNSSASIHLSYQTQFYQKASQMNVSYLAQIKNILIKDNKCIRLLKYACRGNISNFITNNYYSSQQDKIQHIKAVKNILWQVLKGLEQIHSLGYAYRDLKPENIVVNHEGRILLADFGLVAPFGQIDQSICGTPEYISPQRISKTRKTLPINQSLDFWSFGILAFQLLMGYTPYTYEEGNINSLLESIYGSHASFDPELPAYCKQFVYGLLQSNPLKRMSIKKIKQHQFFQDVQQYNLQCFKCNCKLIQKH